jgi:multimeric flavodoxin WrbA
MIPASVATFIDAEVAAATTSYDDLRVVVLNGTLKRSPEPSHTDGLLSVTRRVLEGVGARVDVVRLVDHVIPPGVQPDMREHGWERDDFPDLYRSLVEPADIVVLATPIWLGDQSSLTRLAIERLYGWSGELNAKGQWSYYGKVGGVVVTGNEDGGSTARRRCSTR